jgi:Flp pilus assembly pilin Flp
MQIALRKILDRLQSLLSRVEGQDLVEYVLLMGVIALGATAGMRSIATAVGGVFTAILSALNTNSL